MKYDSLYARLVANTHEPENDQACWIWSGRISNNYPRLSMRLPGREHPVALLAHRTMCEVVLGLPVNWLPSEIEVDHLCKHPHCINPDHIEACAQGVNQKRRDGHDAHCGVSWLLTPESITETLWP